LNRYFRPEKWGRGCRENFGWKTAECESPQRQKAPGRIERTERILTFLFDKNKSIPVLDLLPALQDITRKPLFPCRFVDIDTKTLIAGTHFIGGRTGFAQINCTTFAKLAGPDRKRKIVTIQECCPFNLKNRSAQLSVIMAMNEQNILVCFYHFSFIKFWHSSPDDAWLKSRLTELKAIHPVWRLQVFCRPDIAVPL